MPVRNRRIAATRVSKPDEGPDGLVQRRLHALAYDTIHSLSSAPLGEDPERQRKIRAIWRTAEQQGR